MEITVRGLSLPDAYHTALTHLYHYGDLVDCRDWNTSCKELSMTMVVEEPIVEPMISKCFIGGHRELQQYVMEMCDGILDFEVDKGNWSYTYHQRMGEQIDFVINELRRNPSSRRAVISIRTPDDIGSDDPACLQHIQYFIRNNKLNCIVIFRSNDACKATFMNAFALILLQKRIADSLNVEVGTYTHRANSFHCYEKDYELLNGYVNRIERKSDLTYNYVGDWQDEMLEAIPEIINSVTALKER